MFEISRHAPIVKFLKFCLVGALCTLLNLIMIWLLTYKLNQHYIISATISFFTINLFGFIINRHYTFKAQAGARTQIAKYHIVMLGSFSGNLLLMTFLVELMRINILAASLCVTTVFLAINFLCHLNWTFSKR